MNVSASTLKIIKALKKCNKITTINELYRGLYEYEPNTAGIYSMISEAFREVWEARGKTFFDIERMLSDSLPCNTWRVGGETYRDDKTFSGKQIMEAQILAMVSYIRLTEVKYIDNYGN